MKFKEKLKYISNRALVLGTVVFGSFIILAVIQLLLAYKGETPWWGHNYNNICNFVSDCILAVDSPPLHAL